MEEEICQQNKKFVTVSLLYNYAHTSTRFFLKFKKSVMLFCNGFEFQEKFF